MTNPSGAAAVPAAHSRSRVSKKDSMILGTFGRSGFGSSASAGLTASLVSKLQMRVRGSILYRLTWKATVTPSGRLIYRLRASPVRTAVNGFSSWPTPTTPSGGQSVPPGTTASGRRPDGSKATVTLENVAVLQGWQTPATVDRPRSEETMAKCLAFRKQNANQNSVPLYLGEQASLSAWATPSARDWKGATDEKWGTNARPLNEQVVLSGWPTSRAADGGKNTRTLDGALSECARKGGPQDLVSAALLTGFSDEIKHGARLNPAHSRWLMRLPPVWDSCGAMVTPLMRKR